MSDAVMEACFGLLQDTSCSLTIPKATVTVCVGGYATSSSCTRVNIKEKLCLLGQLVPCQGVSLGHPRHGVDEGAA